MTTITILMALVAEGRGAPCIIVSIEVVSPRYVVVSILYGACWYSPILGGTMNTCGLTHRQHDPVLVVG